MEELRAEFPVLERVAYLNAGSNGPVPRRAAQAAAAALEQQLSAGRAGEAFFDGVTGAGDRLRPRVAAMLGCEPGQVALTANTTDGVNTALRAIGLEKGDEVLTSDEEHPGVLVPLNVARARGVRVRTAPFAELAAAVRPETKLVVCSHVSWVNGQTVDAAELAASDARVLLDGAQGLGAIGFDVEALGCDFYAATGQKWLCGPNGIGYLYVRGELAAELPPARPGYTSVSDPQHALDSPLKPDAGRFDSASPAPEHYAWALASLDVLEAAGIEAVHERATLLAARLAHRLAERGATVAPRSPTTLVSWEDPDPPAAAERLLGERLVVRHLPGTPYVRASVGAWNSEDELERLAELAL